MTITADPAASRSGLPLVVGVDSSTHATKVQVRDVGSGQVLWQGSNPHPPTSAPRAEQDPAAWWQALLPLLDDAWDWAGAQPPSAISVAAQQHGMVVLDAQGTVLRPAKLWNDTESAPDAEQLVAALGGPAPWAAATGSVPGPAFTISKLAWLRRCEPEVFARVATVLLPHDWLTGQLSGELVTDRGDASGTGYFSPAQNRWMPELLGLVGLTEAVTPHVMPPDAAVGEVRGVLVGAGTGDNMAAALGIALRPGDVMVSIGTSGTVFAVSETPTADATGAVAGFADASGRYLPLVSTLNAARVTDTVTRLLGIDHGRFDQLAMEGTPGAGGLVLVPYFDGERNPNRPTPSGTLAGLRTDATPASLARATVEGVVCGLLEGLDALGSAGVPMGMGRLVLVGGGARSAAYRQVLADLSQRPVTVPTGGDLVVAGACAQAASLVTGRSAPEMAASWGLDQGQIIEPDPRVDAPGIRRAYWEARVRSISR